MLLWTDRAGRFAPLKCAAFAGVLIPAFWIANEAAFGLLGERPVTEAIHQFGLWAVRLLAVTLAITPLRLAMRWPKLISIQRILGVSVLAYALLHFALYIVNQHFNLAHVASEIISRIYHWLYCLFRLVRSRRDVHRRNDCAARFREMETSAPVTG
jgi:sulfoxide reductase heme-binding subunit YedZ